jgi:hypothetical protein
MYFNQQYDRLDGFLLPLRDSRGSRYRLLLGQRPELAVEDALALEVGVAMREGEFYVRGGRSEEVEITSATAEQRILGLPPFAGKGQPGAPAGGQDPPGTAPVKVRTDFNETAFFFPRLLTNEQGEVILSFTVPEALTRWRLLAFAHTRDLMVGSLECTTVTQKELMVMPSAPRFLREDDRIVLPAKITNMSGQLLSGRAELQLFDAITMKPVAAAFSLAASARDFAIEKSSSTSVNWDLRIPADIDAVVYRIVARAGSFSDGEEAALPVLPNRMLVTESLPLSIRGNQSRSFRFEKLLGASSSPSLRHRQLTLEMTSNPAWYAIQALPYLMEYPHECSEQVFNRYYANSIAAYVINSSPRIKRLFDQWRGSDAMLSSLHKNQELKSVLLQEAPWVMQARSESMRRQRLGLLFDLNQMADRLDREIRTLERLQQKNGGWPWFPGMPVSRHITQYMVAGFGHLKALGITIDDARVQRMINLALSYLDRQINREYQELKASAGPLDQATTYIRHDQIQYLYARSFFLDQEIPEACQEAVDFWLEQARRHWTATNIMGRGMIALTLHRFADPTTPGEVIASLRENALRSEELGMYWHQDRGWLWHQAPIQTQALLIEAFDEIAGDGEAVEEMKIWLLKQKQVQDWQTTVATADACYALLRRGRDLLASDRLVEVSLAGQAIDPRNDGWEVEAGTGYYQVSWAGSEVRPEQGHISVRKHDEGIAWGAVYWQYFEQLDRITPAESPLQVDKQLFLQKNTDKGPVLEPITAQSSLEVGNILMVRIEIRADRDMEYIHLKDMRGTGLEPINQLSRYRSQGGLGYYEAPKDASVNFFMHWLPKGVYVLEYPLRVSHSGRFSNGITTIQSMYAPEFASHTAGVTVTVR